MQEKAWSWANDNKDALASAEPDIPSTLHDRGADNWRPLLAIADLLGVSEEARSAALSLSSSSLDDAGSIRETLLLDIKSIFEDRKTTVLFSRDLIEDLTNMEGHPWAEFKRGNPISPNTLARELNFLH